MGGRRLLALRSNQLISIDFPHYLGDETKNKKFPRLENLALMSPSASTLDAILGNAKMVNLKRITISISCPDNWQWNRVFVGNPMLEHLSLEIKDASKYENFIKCIE